MVDIKMRGQPGKRKTVDSMNRFSLLACCIRSDHEGACAGRVPPLVVFPVIRDNKPGADPDATPRHAHDHHWDLPASHAEC